MFKFSSNAYQDCECQNHLVLTLSLLAACRLVVSAMLPVVNLVPFAEIWKCQGHGGSGFFRLPHLTITDTATTVVVLLMILAVVWAKSFKSLVLRSSQDHV